MRYKIQNTRYKIQNTGFTLVELLVVIALIGILAGLAVGNFRTAQIKARDAQRKSDLKQVTNALELFLNDHQVYPTADSAGRIEACPWTSPGAGTACDWGAGEMKDANTVYMKLLPMDPYTPRLSWFYRYRASGDGKKYQLYAALENTDDPGYDPAVEALGLLCGTATCNFAIVSPNTTPTESL